MFLHFLKSFTDFFLPAPMFVAIFLPRWKNQFLLEILWDVLCPEDAWMALVAVSMLIMAFLGFNIQLFERTKLLASVMFPYHTSFQIILI